MTSISRRPRISIDVDPELRHRLRLAAARRDVTVRQYLLDAIQNRLQQDAEDGVETNQSMNALGDPVLAELWDNPHDAAYDGL